VVEGSVYSPVRGCRLLGRTRRGLHEILPVPSAAIHNRGDEKMRFDNAEYRTL
jgi:hypothetical protein